MMNPPSVSVIIPACDSQDTVGPALEAVLCQSALALEVIVVDDGSTDGTAEVVRSFPEVKYLFQENRGPAAARNRGARQARGDILVFTDSDCRPRRDWLEQLARGFMSDDVAAVAGGYGIANPESLLARCVHQEILYRHRFLMPDYPRSFGSYNVAIRRDVFFQVNGFDESYRRASGEDNDLSYRILKSGKKIYFARQALVDHRHPWRLSRYLKEQFRHGYWRARMYRVHPDMMAGDGYTFWKDAVEAPLSLLVLFSGAAGLVIFPGVLNFLFYGSLAALLFIEAGFAVRMGEVAAERLFLSGMMFVRSFARSFGFLAGLLPSGLCGPSK
jgi:glycosyltransferase involved in cell wall biosynthesis